MRDLACWWDSNTDQWYVNVPFLLSPMQMQAVRDRVLEVNVRRLVGMRAGDAKDDLTRGVDALRLGKMRQNIVTDTVFKSAPAIGNPAYSIAGGGKIGN